MFSRFIIFIKAFGEYTGKTHTLNATLAENKSAVAFAELLKKGALSDEEKSTLHALLLKMVPQEN